jgi:phage protein U
MALFGVLGVIEFQLLTSPEEFEATREYTYAKHQVVEDTPRLQWLARDLEEIELALFFHQSFCLPVLEIELLNGAAEAHQALPLVLGNGIFRGYYVIKRIVERWVHAADDGSIISAQCRVGLEEYAQTRALKELEQPAPATPPPGVSPSAPPQPGTTVLSGVPLPIAPTVSYESVSALQASRIPDPTIESRPFGGVGGTF